MKLVIDNSIPKCQVTGCGKNAQNITGGDNPKYRKSKWVCESYNVTDGWVCSSCHTSRIARLHGVSSIVKVIAKNAGYDTVGKYLKQQALDAGWESYTDYVNSKHPYLKHRKTYCENIDGRLGFTCTYTPPAKEQLALMKNMETTFKGWLQVDHKDGNHRNNKQTNLQTLCACCHTIKTAMNKDYATPGRKTRKAA